MVHDYWKYTQAVDTGYVTNRKQFIASHKVMGMVDRGQRKQDNVHYTGTARPLLAWLPWLDDGDGVPFAADGDRAECSTISRFAPRGGDAERECIRSSSTAPGAAVAVGERAAIGGSEMPADPWLPSEPTGRGCGGSIVGNDGLGGYDRTSTGCRISGECDAEWDVGCWRNGMGDWRAEGVGVGLPVDGGETRRVMLPTLERFTSMLSSGPGLRGRLVPEGGDGRDDIEGRLGITCGEVTTILVGVGAPLPVVALKPRESDEPDGRYEAKSMRASATPSS